MRKTTNWVFTDATERDTYDNFGGGVVHGDTCILDDGSTYRWDSNLAGAWIPLVSGYTRNGASVLFNTSELPILWPASMRVVLGVSSSPLLTLGGPATTEVVAGPAPRALALKRLTLSLISPGGLGAQSLTVSLLADPAPTIPSTSIESVGPLAVLDTGAPVDFTFGPAAIGKADFYSLFITGWVGSVPAGATARLFWEAEFTDLGGA